MRVCVLAAALVAAGCGGGELAKVKGKVTENGEVPTFTGSAQPAVVLRPVGADGKADPARSYSMFITGDGSFELVAAGGSVPPGNYQLSLDVTGKAAVKYKGFAITRELKPGDNNVTFDLAKPGG